MELTNGRTGQATLARTPALIGDDWAALKQAGFTFVDAVLPNPANPEGIYIFSGGQCIVVNVSGGTVHIPLVSAARRL